MSRDTKEMAKACGYFVGVTLGISLVSFGVRKIVEAVFD